MQHSGARSGWQWSVLDILVLMIAVSIALAISKVYGDWNYPHFASPFGLVVLLLFALWKVLSVGDRAVRPKWMALAAISLMTLLFVPTSDRALDWVVWDKYSDFSTSLQGMERNLWETSTALGQGVIYPLFALGFWLIYLWTRRFARPKSADS